MIPHLFFALAAATVGQDDGASSLDRLLACESQADNRRRLACYDEGARSVRRLRGAAVRALDATPTRPPRAAFAPVASPVRDVAALRPGFWRVALADGSVWQNVDWTGAVPRIGKEMAIRKGALGALWARTDGLPVTKVRRER
jgi:hypothetical protein